MTRDADAAGKVDVLGEFFFRMLNGKICIGYPFIDTRPYERAVFVLELLEKLRLLCRNVIKLRHPFQRSSYLKGMGVFFF